MDFFLQFCRSKHLEWHGHNVAPYLLHEEGQITANGHEPMNLITGDAPLYHHRVQCRDHHRTVASRFIVGHVKPDGSWDEFVHTSQAAVGSRTGRGKLEAGQVTTLESPDPESFTEAATAALESLCVTAELPSAFDSQILLCRGAAFHNDLHGWDNALFLNWYLAGPSRDIVVAGIGHVTLHPGDVVLFDPSRPHALLREGEKRFVKTGWGGEPEDHSIFLSCDIALTAELDGLFGIQRAKEAAAFNELGSVDIERLRILRTSGKAVENKKRA